MGFLILTCIEPVSSFFGCIPLRLAMIIAAAMIVVCGGYSYFEAKVFFKDYTAFGLINIELWFILELAVALLVFVDFFITKKSYTRILYLVTIGLAGFTLAYNVFKISIFDDKVNSDYNVDHKLFQFMFMIRVGAEFIIEMLACYICYSYKKKL